MALDQGHIGEKEPKILPKPARNPALDAPQGDNVHEHVTVAEGRGTTAEREGAKSKAVHNAEFFAAVQETKIDPWSRNSFHLYFSILVAFCCACANGYDTSLMTGLIAMEQFQGMFNVGTTGPQVSLIFSLYTVGAIVSSPFAAILSDRFGRRRAMMSGAIVIVVGMIIASTSSTISQFVVGRFVLGFGIAIMTVAAPAYAVEISPPHWRGRCTGFYNVGWFGGSIPAALVCFGCNYIPSDYAWRIPLILQAGACVIVLLSIPFIPESPRFLMANGRDAEAIAFLAKYHGNGDASARLVLLEIEEMREQIRQDGIDKSSWDYRPLVLTHSGRWRMAQVLMISIFGQFSGNGLGYFNTEIFKNLGVDSVAQQLGYNCLNAVLSATGALVAAGLTDMMPRRRVLVLGTLASAAMLLVNASLSKAIENDGEVKRVGLLQGGLASYFLFNVVFHFTYTPLQAVVVTEALETTTRAKGLAVSAVVVNAMGFINQFAGPIALENIRNNYVWVFVGWDVVEAALWWLFGVEAQGRTLEQLEWVYDQPNPVKASLMVDRVIVQADGTVTEKVVGAAPVP